jgi:Zn-dependent protease with chaperone function
MDARKRRSLTQRAALAAVLWLGFWLLGLMLVGALLWVPIAQSRYEGEVGPSGWLAGFGAVAVAWALRPRQWFRRNKSEEVKGLDRVAFPALHDLLSEAAQGSGGGVADEVRLLAQSTAFIRAERKGLFEQRHVIGLGLPLFAFLSREELATVLMHEFGHSRGGDLRLGPWVHRTGSSLASAIDTLEGSAFFLDAPFRVYGSLFLRVSGEVSREQERAADAHAAAVYGVDATWKALEKVHRLGRYWEVYFALDAVPLIGLGCRLPLLEGFRRFLALPVLRPQVAEALASSTQTKATPGDTHPPAEERLAALAPNRVPPSGRTEDDLQSQCLDLLGGEEAAERAWYERATTGELTSVGWDDVGSTVLLPKIVEAFSKTSVNPGTTPLSTLPDNVLAADAFWECVRAPGMSLLSPAAKRRAGARVLVDWLAVALFTRGFRADVRPGGYLRLSRGETTVIPAEIVEQLVRGTLTRDAYQELSAGWDEDRSTGGS